MCVGLFVSAVTCRLQLRDEFDAVQYLDWERSIKHCPVGILDII